MGNRLNRDSFACHLVVCSALLMLACERSKRETELPVLAITAGEIPVLEATIARSDLVFRGRVALADRSSHIWTGAIVPSFAWARYRVTEVFKGDPSRPDYADVFPLFLSDAEAYIELEPDTGRPRLARAFFSRGSEHIVIAQHADLHTGEGKRYFVFEEGIWSDTPSNLARIRRLIESTSAIEVHEVLPD